MSIFASATAFYDAFHSLFGAVKYEGQKFTTWRIPQPASTVDDAPDNFGIVEHREHRVQSTVAKHRRRPWRYSVASARTTSK